MFIFTIPFQTVYVVVHTLPALCSTHSRKVINYHSPGEPCHLGIFVHRSIYARTVLKRSTSLSFPNFRSFVYNNNWRHPAGEPHISRVVADECSGAENLILQKCFLFNCPCSGEWYQFSGLLSHCLRRAAFTLPNRILFFLKQKNNFEPNLYFLTNL